MRTGRGIAGVVAAGALVVLAGWWLDVPALRPSLAGAAMGPSTALTIVATSLAVALLAPRDAPRWARRSGRAAAAGVVVAHLVFLGEQVLGLDVGLERVMPEGDELRPAIETSLTLVAIGLALLVLDWRPRRGAALGELFVLGGAVGALLVPIGYLYGFVHSLDGDPFREEVGMAVHTAIAAIGLAVATLLIRPRSPIMAVLTSVRPGGALARRLLVTAGIAAPGFGALSLLLVRIDALPASGAAVLGATFCLVVVLGATVVLGSALDRAEVDRARALDDQVRLASVVASTDDAVIAADRRGQVTAWNGGAERLLGWTADEMLGRAIARLVPPELAADQALLLDRLLQHGEPQRAVETDRLHKDGRRVPVSLTVSPLRGADGIIGFSAIARDVSERRALERLRQEWTSVVAHDLRQPLHGIDLAAQMLAHARLGAREEAWAARIRREARQLAAMIDDLLDASRLEASRLELHVAPTGVAAIVDDAISRVAEPAGRFVVAIPADLTVTADSSRATQIVGNLLSNAVKYGAPGAPITIAAVRDGDAARLTVTNRGAGIPADEIPTVFDRFTRSRAARRGAIAGTGLGLYICKGLAEAHGGTIWVDSTPGETTTFHVTLPLAVIAPPPPAPPDAIPATPEVAGAPPPAP